MLFEYNVSAFDMEGRRNIYTGYVSAESELAAHNRVYSYYINFVDLFEVYVCSISAIDDGIEETAVTPADVFEDNNADIERFVNNRVIRIN